MTEAERYLQNRGKREASLGNTPTHLPAVNAADPDSDRTDMPTPVPLGIKWLNFVNYVQIPVAGCFCLLAIILLLAKWDYVPDPGILLVSYCVSMGLLIATFVGLKNRKPWGWWLVMINFVLAAPTHIWTKYIAAQTQAGTYIMIGVVLFLLIFLPQLIYFYNRRAMFGIRFGNDR